MENKIVNVLVIFGATGDLASIKIFPAINEIYKSNKLPKNFHIIGCGRKEVKKNIFNDLKSDLLEKNKYLKLDPTLDNDYKVLVNELGDFMHANKYKYGTIARHFSSNADLLDPNKVKVIINDDNSALEFFRDTPVVVRDFSKLVLHHLGIYAYQVDFLNTFSGLSKTENENPNLCRLIFKV